MNPIYQDASVLLDEKYNESPGATDHNIPKFCLLGTDVYLYADFARNDILDSYKPLYVWGKISGKSKPEPSHMRLSRYFGAYGSAIRDSIFQSNRGIRYQCSKMLYEVPLAFIVQKPFDGFCVQSDPGAALASNTSFCKTSAVWMTTGCDAENFTTAFELLAICENLVYLRLSIPLVAFSWMRGPYPEPPSTGVDLSLLPVILKPLEKTRGLADAYIHVPHDAILHLFSYAQRNLLEISEEAAAATKTATEIIQRTFDVLVSSWKTPKETRVREIE